MKLQKSFGSAFLLCLLWQSDPAVEWNQKGVELLEKGDVEAAVQAFHKAYQLKSDDKIIQKNLAVAYFQQGQARLEKKWYEGAVGSYTNAMQIDGETSRYPLFIGYSYFLWGNYARAIEELAKTVQKFPKEIDAYRLLGEAYYNTHQHLRSIEALEKGIQLLQEVPAKETEKEKQSREKKIQENQVLLAKVRKEEKVERNFTPDSSNHFDFLYDGSNRDDLVQNAGLIARDLEDAYAIVGEHFGVYPTTRLQVLFYEPKEFSETTSTDHWVGGIFDGKIRIPVRNYRKEKARIREVIFHEYTHAVIHQLTRNCPTWMNEGLAQIEEGLKSKDAEKRLRSAAARQWLSMEEIKGPFVSLSAERARMAYDISLSLTQYLLRDYGYAAFSNYLRQLGEAKKTESQIFREVFGQSFEDLFQNWKSQFGT